MRLRRRRTEDGAVAVEFALVLVFVLLPLVFGIIDFGYLFAQNLALSNGARQAARYAAVENRTCADVEAEAVSATAPLVELTAGAVAITRDSSSNPCGSGDPCEGSTDGDNVSIALTYEATVLVPVVPGLGNTKTLHGTGVFRCEFS